MPDGIRHNELFYCEHLGASEQDERDVLHFSVAAPDGQGLVNYLKYMAFPEEESGTMRTYLIHDDYSSEMVGYYSLKAGLISVNEVHTVDGIGFDTIPGVEVANLAINQEYLKMHPELKGLGLIVFNDFILPTVQDVAESIGIKIIYIFALPFGRLIDRYKEYGFQRLDSSSEMELHRRLKPNYDKNCVFMFQLLG